LHPPFCTPKVKSRKPSDDYIHRPALTHLTPAKHYSQYIHCPPITQITPTNHHNHYIHRPALTS